MRGSRDPLQAFPAVLCCGETRLPEGPPVCHSTEGGEDRQPAQQAPALSTALPLLRAGPSDPGRGGCRISPVILAFRSTGPGPPSLRVSPTVPLSRLRAQGALEQSCRGVSWRVSAKTPRTARGWAVGLPGTRREELWGKILDLGGPFRTLRVYLHCVEGEAEVQQGKGSYLRCHIQSGQRPT